ncbi:MAG: hypothetical protein LBQ30_10080, partial [Treponema sp.]|nr:hypothetical protein [Treponema sp.]
MTVWHDIKHSGFRLFLYVLTGAVILYAFASCVSAGAVSGSSVPAQPETKPAGAKPGWVDVTPKSDRELFFIGVSRACSNAADARKAAREDAFNQVLRYYGEYIQAASVEKTSTVGNTADTLDSYLEREEELIHFAQGVVSQVGMDRYYTEVYT